MPYEVIDVLQVKVCRTQVKCPPDPIWEEDFVLDLTSTERPAVFMCLLASHGRFVISIIVALWKVWLSRDIPSDITTFTITLYNKGKRSKDTEIGMFYLMMPYLILSYLHSIILGYQACKAC
ncbi:RASA1 [Cordylochernes scorpioides]|uniref:RASA1 n=1 Tax=Cordylochernes scorpioides TaxID=51811 RepID=A0ABY6L683_9ARAC|nr:RASA1 [Cordylochernes scorpioides]